MIRRIISVALHQPAFVLMLVAVFVGVGIAAFRALPVEAFPDVTDVQVTVISLFPGHAPEEVEKQVTIPVEVGLAGIPNSVRMFSHTQLAPLSTAIGEIYRYQVKGNGVNATDLRTTQDWVISRNLKLIPGVADVVS